MKYLIVLSFILGFLFEQSSFAQKAENLVVSCNACHGEKGISNNNLWPNLAGQKKDYLIKQLKNFRSEERKDPVMNPMTKTLSDDDINNLAEYFSSLK
jgi:cytochrome c553